jgi:hypothetical protein
MFPVSHLSAIFKNFEMFYLILIEKEKIIFDFLFELLPKELFIISLSIFL